MTTPAIIRAIIVMGVSGSGKSTIGEALARRTGMTFQDGDSLHPPANVEKMRAGIPLTDADRRPWLTAIAKAIDQAAAADTPLVVACSALKRGYRDLLIHDRQDVCIVFLKGTEALIAERMARRRGHFMPASLLASQFATLEVPGPDEPAIAVDIDQTVDKIVDDIVGRLDLTKATT